jgi:hypothetical protein
MQAAPLRYLSAAAERFGQRPGLNGDHRRRPVTTSRQNLRAEALLLSSRGISRA